MWPRRPPVVSTHLGMGLSSSGSHIILASTVFHQRSKGGLVVEGGVTTGVAVEILVRGVPPCPQPVPPRGSVKTSGTW